MEQNKEVLGVSPGGQVLIFEFSILPLFHFGVSPGGQVLIFEFSILPLFHFVSGK